MTIDLILYIVAAVLFALAFFGVNAKFDLVAGGLFAWVLTNIV
jgi:hypothetical protein